MSTPSKFEPTTFTRPSPGLFSYYLIIAICTLPAVIGIFEGVDNAPAIREAMLLKLRNCKTAGLGDERNQSDGSILGSSKMSVKDIDLLREIRDLTSDIASKRF